MYWHVENVMQRASVRGGEWQVLVALAHRADASGMTSMSHQYLADLVGLSRRQIMRLLASLSDAGYIRTWSAGAGRAARTYYELNGDICDRNGDTSVTIGAETVTPMSPLEGDSGPEMVTPVSPLEPEMVTSATGNGDTGVTHKDLKEKKRRGGSPPNPPGSVDDDQNLPLERAFDQRGYFVPAPGHPTYEEQWRPFFERWREVFQGVDLAAEVGAALDYMASNGLTVAGPRSLRNTLPALINQRRAAPAQNTPASRTVTMLREMLAQEQ